MNEDWKTQEIRDAEAALEEALANAERVGARADEMNRELPEAKLSEEQTERIEQLVRRGEAPEGIAELQRRVDEGELSWEDVAEGRALQDEGVQSAFASGVPNMQQAKEMLDEGHEVAEIIENDPNRPPE
ncbi:Arc/MetJ-type ribon-helix-helix transcriptional regulator [Actinopolyspora biskrensis]|uniref:Arc/MetJ-type ribon-helix-helix transcriptional regulator n=1 Tax=Actinopolyspora biskrensis TaxID=1470178 RepID=A0A852YX67_9ACTN|nr:Arc/MetJ-type ribon-helix-helix transcriptional regulator [Actinopolyspora biskrensis]